jgi:hypothetical protein
MKSAGDNTMLMMMKMMESQSNQTTALLTAMLQGNGRKEPDISVEKIMNLMDSRMEKVISLVQGKDKTKDIDALKLIELQSMAEDRGYKRAMDLHSQAEKKAEELSELRDSMTHPEREREQGPSTTKMLLDALVPAAQAFMSSRGMPSMVPGIAPGAVSGTTPTTPTINPHVPAKPMPANLRNQMLLRPPVPTAKPVVTVKPAPVPTAPKVAGAVTIQQPKQEMNPMNKKELVESTVISEIGKDLSRNLLTQKFNPEGTADATLSILSAFGVTPQWLCSQYDLNAMMGIAKAKGMPDAIKPYIERFHAQIKIKAGMGLGEPAKSS